MPQLQAFQFVIHITPIINWGWIFHNLCRSDASFYYCLYIFT